MSTTRVNFAREEGVVETGGTRVILTSAAALYGALTRTLRENLGDALAYDVYFSASQKGAEAFFERALEEGILTPDARLF